MAYGDRGKLSHTDSGRPVNLSSHNQYGTRLRTTLEGTYHGPRGTAKRGNGLRGPSRGRGGYPLRERNINFQSGRARKVSDNRRLLILAALALVLVILIVVGISSCMRGSAANQDTTSTNPVDTRVASGVDEELTGEFAVELNRYEKLASIAANADKYSDQGLLELALSEPDAIDFVAAYPDAEKDAQPYGDAVTKGAAPELYCWDARWGSVTYVGRPLALTGSGPTALSMAYMGLTGKNDRTPADIAELVTTAEKTNETSGMSGSFLEESLGDLGLSCSTSTSNADNLSQVLDTDTYVLLETTAGSLTDTAHWVIAVSENEDGSIAVFDPTSSQISAHPWDPATLASCTTTLYAVSAADASGGGETSE